MIHCFYHSADLDGHCSGAILKYRFPDAVMHPINYGDPFPWEEIHPDDEVYMVDFALQPFNLMIKLGKHCELIWIDHHKSSIDEVFACPAIIRAKHTLNPGKAACELTWEYLFPDKPVPLAVKLLGLYDSWSWELCTECGHAKAIHNCQGGCGFKGSDGRTCLCEGFRRHELEDMVLPFQMRMRMEELDPKDWDYEAGRKGRSLWIKLFSDKKIWHEGFRIDPEDIIDSIVAEGRLLLRYDEAQKAKYARTYAFEMELKWTPSTFEKDGVLYSSLRGTLKAVAVNLGHTNSKVFDSVWRKECPPCKGSGKVKTTGKDTDCLHCLGVGYLEPYDLMITFVRRTDKLWNVSLYSTKEYVDCGAIAKSFGGGGHKGAAGFQCKELPFEY